MVSPTYGLIRELSLVEPDPSEPGRPFVIVATLANHAYLSKEHADRFSCSGKGFSYERAVEGALGEAVERYSAGFLWPEEITRTRRSELPNRAIDPRELVLYHPSQYAHLPYVQYQDESLIGWVRARSLTTNDFVWVPALSVFLTYACGPEEFLFPATSNGLAAGPTLQTAILAAALEAIERDAVMIGWLNRLYRDRWEPSTHPDASTRHLVEAYRRRGVQIGLFRMYSDVDLVSVFVAVGHEPERMPAAVFGLGADFDPATAAAKAVAEVAQIRPALRRRLRQPETQARVGELLEDPTRVSSLDDHHLLYAHPDSLKHLQFLLSGPVYSKQWPSSKPARTLRDLVDNLRALGHELIYYDVSTPDLEKLGLRAARAIIPQFQPIDFGWAERRLGGRRLYELPVALGLRSRPSTMETLNRNPHPIA